MPSLADKVAEIVERLEARYGIADLPVSEWGLYGLVVRTILSQQTSGNLVERAYRNLVARHPDFGSLARADVADIARCIRVAGLYRRKAEKLKEVAGAADELESALSLPVEEARKALLALPGIGEKTADILLLFYANKPRFPVDTHIKRITKRLGLTPCRSYEGISSVYERLLDSPRDLKSLHLNMIRFGREICKARMPDCHLCFLSDLCPSYQP